ncbi:MAG: PrgI family protein [Candidatus Pacearchaeota archaeon]
MAIFQVPQFLDIKPKIFGPFDFSQFAYIFIDVILVYIFIKTFNLTLAIILSLITSTLTFALAFLKINGLPFIKILNNLIKFYIKPQNYIWQKNYKKIEIKEEEILNIRKSITLKERLNDITNKLISKKNISKEKSNNLTILKNITGEKIKAKKIDYL